MSADIDIDVADRTQILSLIPHVLACQQAQGQTRLHNSGYYPTHIPWNPVDGCAAIDYETADQRGYFKIDLLNMSVYQLLRDHDHYRQMLEKEPNWSLLLTQSFCEKVVHVGNHYNLILQLQPSSIPQMAMFLAVIRPAKRHLQNQDWKTIAEHVWTKPTDDSYYFKKSHSLGYAMLVALHINLLEEQLNQPAGRE